MPAAPVDTVTWDKAVTDKVLADVMSTSSDDKLNKLTADKAIFVPAYTDTAPVALRDMYPVLATDKPVDPANTLIDPPELRAKYSLADIVIDEAWIDMVFAAERVRMLRE